MVGAKKMVLPVVNLEVDLLSKLVLDELDRRCAAIDDIVVQGYGEYIGKRAEGNQEALKAGVLELVRSPLADLERKLACVEPEPEEKPAEVAEPAEGEAPAGKKQPKK